MLEGNTFVVSDLAGDLAASPTDTLGMFAWDTRHLSRWVLTVNGQTLNPLATGAVEYYATQFFLVPTACEPTRPWSQRRAQGGSSPPRGAWHPPPTRRARRGCGR